MHTIPPYVDSESDFFLKPHLCGMRQYTLTRLTSSPVNFHTFNVPTDTVLNAATIAVQTSDAALAGIYQYQLVV